MNEKKKKKVAKRGKENEILNKHMLAGGDPHLEAPTQPRPRGKGPTCIFY